MPGHTREKVLIAFNYLLSTRDFHRITVDAIVQKAGISRATFYRHFKDKYDVMNFNYTSILNDSLSGITYTSMEGLFERLLLTGKMQGESLLPLFATYGPNSFHEYIRDYSFTAARNIYETQSLYGTLPAYRSLNEKQKIQLMVFCHGAAGFFEEWIKGVHSLSAKDAAAVLYEILPEFMKGDLWQNTI